MGKIVIIGGGLAGLITSIQLARAGIACTVVEKKSYPLHRVCGEYISNEALPFLKSSGLYPDELILPQINFFEFSSVSGKSVRLPLDLGGFGISRFAFDDFLYRVARKEGVDFRLNTEVSSVTFKNDEFQIETRDHKFSASIVIGSFGKRSRIDVQQDRNFIKERSPYLGVKYHALTDHPDDQVSLHNFRGGYCGVCQVEGGVTNICYLTHRDNVRKSGDIPVMERNIVFQNPLLKSLFNRAEFIFDKPEVISEISFATKHPVENHILMAGDAAGMITPVCGNGMAMAIYSATMLAALTAEYYAGRLTRQDLEQRYTKAWNAQFARRLWLGRNVQRLFGSPLTSGAAVYVAQHSKPIANLIIRNTHGSPF